MRSFCILILLMAVGLLAATSGNLRESPTSTSLLPSFFNDIAAVAPHRYLSSILQSINQLTSFTQQNTVTYSLTSTYSDDSCTTMITSAAMQIKQCYKSSGNYTKITSVLASGKVTTIKTNYKDSACTKVIGKPVTKSGTTGCTSGQGGYFKSDVSSEFVFSSTSAGVQIK